MLSTCQSCGGGDLEVFYSVFGVPAHSCLLMRSREEARGYPRGDVELAFCAACGFIQNQRFEPELHEYSTRYEETQAFSPRFNVFADDLIRRLIDRFDLRDRAILEIGCGKGEFLTRICELGPNDGIGIDPGYRPERNESAAASRIRFLQEFYGPHHAALRADFVCCRHTLEHIQPVRRFVEDIAATLAGAPDTPVFFEVPDTLRILREAAFWDIYYEHCSYFTLGSLARLFERVGFSVTDLELDFGDQYLLICAALQCSELHDFPAARDLAQLQRAVAEFSDRISADQEGWRTAVRARAGRGGGVVLWGSGSKGVSFLTTLGLDDEVSAVVDINPFRQGRYMPGSGHAIVSPEALQRLQPTCVVVMNPVYRLEIAAQLEKLGIDAEVLAVGENEAPPAHPFPDSEPDSRSA